MNNCKRQNGAPILNGLWTNYRVIEIVSSDGFKDLVTFRDKVGLDAVEDTFVQCTGNDTCSSIFNVRKDSVFYLSEFCSELCSLKPIT